MIQWCPECKTNPISSNEILFYGGKCFPCVADGVGRAFDKAVLYGEVPVPECYQRKQPLRVQVEPDVSNLMAEVKRRQDEAFRKWDQREWEMILFGPHQEHDHIIRGEN